MVIFSPTLTGLYCKSNNSPFVCQLMAKHHPENVGSIFVVQDLSTIFLLDFNCKISRLNTVNTDFFELINFWNFWKNLKKPKFALISEAVKFQIFKFSE